MEPIAAIRWKLFGAIVVLGFVVPLLSCGTCVAFGGGLGTTGHITNTAMIFWFGSWALGGTIAIGWLVYETFRAVTKVVKK